MENNRSKAPSLGDDVGSRLASIFSGDYTDVFNSTDDEFLVQPINARSSRDLLRDERGESPDLSRAFYREEGIPADDIPTGGKFRVMSEGNDEKQRIDSTRANYGDDTETSGGKNPYPYQDDGNGDSGYSGLLEATKRPFKDGFSGGDIYQNLQYGGDFRSRNGVREIHLPRLYPGQPSAAEKEFAREGGKMSYMYSGGYGNSGYEYDRGGYYDRHTARPDPRDISMYPTKKDLIQTGPSRIDYDHRPRWGWCLTILSIIVSGMCCPIFGLIGYSFVTHAYTDHKSGDFLHVRYKRKCAWGWTITGLIIGILGWLALIVIYALIWSGQWAKLLAGTA